ncbi:uncharacterized protein LOC131604303 [Vicia villosa]|uniref:uncharacterized protein LOC131604303 n=1 Tax=Vicia villosa TaxID=3911 RepID=UPI00273C3782|nr:uncharacterized protein LOC131604303 [Vicia villosa]
MNINENIGYGQELAHLLRDNINKIVQDFRFEPIDITPVYESSKRGKLLTTILLKRKIFSFSFPIDFKITCFSGIDNMLSNLKNWEVQYRMRESGMCDMYYIHPTISGGRKLRSVTEVVNNLLPKEYAKLETRKRKRKDGEDNHEENNSEIEANENTLPQVRVVDLLPSSVFVPRKKRNYKKKVQNRKLDEVEKYIPPKFPIRLEEVLKNKENNVEDENVSCFLSKIEDDKNIPEVGNVFCLQETNDKGNNFAVENVSCPPTIKAKENSFEAENDVCAQEIKDTKKIYEGQNVSCFQEMEDKTINMDVDNVSIEALLNPQDVSLSISEVQPIAPINQGVLEDMFKAYDFENNSTLTNDISNDEVLSEIPDDFFEPRLETIQFHGLSIAEAAILEVPFTKEEIKEVVSEFDENKSPGPDGYNFNFIRKCWHFLEEEVYKFVVEFSSKANLPKAVSASFLALVPKADNPQFLGEYRPIRLVGCLYKIIAKLLANRLKKVVGKLVSQTQTAFIPGRQIQDGVLVLNEVLDYAKRFKRKCMVLKVDFEKAYNNVNWKFLLDTLRRFGFGVRWVRWIEACVCNASLSVLINGSPTADFFMEKGLRQGDPLSPFLFTLVTEGLAMLIKEATAVGAFEGFEIGTSVTYNLL